jgi:two-component system KDP operon response regulator KdpE
MYDSPRILIIEDDKYIQSFISLSLKTNGYVFDRAST